MNFEISYKILLHQNCDFQCSDITLRAETSSTSHVIPPEPPAGPPKFSWKLTAAAIRQKSPILSICQMYIFETKFLHLQKRGLFEQLRLQK